MEKQQTNKMEVLITGATGFIGKHLCKLLCDQGYKVISLVRPGSDTFELSHLPNIQFVFGDVLNHSSLDKLKDFPAIVFHLAADWSSLNVEVDKVFIDYLISRNIRKLIFYSSICASGLDLSTQPLFENTPPRFLPTDFYGKYKFEVESYINQKVSENCFEGINLRPTIVYGPGDLTNLFPLFKALREGKLALWKNGKQMLRTCYVHNLNQTALKIAFGQNKNIPNTLNVGDPELLTLKEITAIIAKSMGYNLKYTNHSMFLAKKMGFLHFALNRFGFTNSFATHFAFNKWTREYNSSNALLEKKLGLEHMLSIETAMQETTLWYKKNNLI